MEIACQQYLTSAKTVFTWIVNTRLQESKMGAVGVTEQIGR